MAVTKPPEMKQGTWDYLLKFTNLHEWPVLHLYNNRSKEDAKQDVTCGIGILLSSPEAAAGYADKFYDPATGRTATPEQMKADWVEASKIFRTATNLETDYARKCKMRMLPETAIDLMASFMKSVLEQALKAPDMRSFAKFPAQAQVAAASFNYGYRIWVTVNLRQALADMDFDRAGKESWLKGISQRKLLAHRVLFYNAARIMEQRRNFDLLPQALDPPEIIPWQPWTETILDMDGGPDQAVSHGASPLLPGTAK